MKDGKRVKFHNPFSDEDAAFHAQLFIDEIEVEGVEFHEDFLFDGDGEHLYQLSSTSSESTKKIASLKFSDFTTTNISTLVFNNWNEIGLFIISVICDLTLASSGKGVFTYVFIPDLLLWNRPYPVVDYFLKFEELWDLSNVGEIVNNHVGERIKIEIKCEFKSEIISEEINRGLEQLLEIHYKTLDNLDQNIASDSILTSFNFPEEIKVSCEQYLLYFAKFLQDLGIEATSNIQEEAGKVLFSVTPTDDVDALDKIREALAVYLNLPSSPIVYDDSFAAMRLQQQIENLQHAQRMAVRELQFNEKLLTAQANMLQEKNITNSQLQFVNEQQAKIIEKLQSKSIMIDSAENKEELETLYEGVEISHSKWFFELTGIKINPVKVIGTAVNNVLGKGDEIIELGLDKKD